MAGMVLCNAITVTPYYLKNRHQYKRMTEIGSLISALCFLSFLIIHIIDFGSINRFINILINPAPNSIVHYVFFILTFSLCIQVLLLIAAYNQRQNATKILIIVSMLWSIAIVIILSLVQSFFDRESTLSLIFGSLTFILVLASGGLIILLCVCKLFDLVSKNRCSAESFRKVRNQIALFLGLLLMSSVTNFILA